MVMTAYWVIYLLSNLRVKPHWFLKIKERPQSTLTLESRDIDMYLIRSYNHKYPWADQRRLRGIKLCTLNRLTTCLR